MHPTPEPPLTDTIPPHTGRASHRAVLFFAGQLPSPAGNTAQDRAEQDNNALAELAALEPANDAEVTQATRCVAAGAWADDQLRLARLYSEDFGRTQQILRQHALMQRTADGARALLLRVQTARRRREKDAEGSERDAALGRDLLASLTEARTAATGQIEASAAAEAVTKAAMAEARAAAEAKVAAAAEAKASGAPWGGQYSAWPAPAPQPPPLSLEEREREKWLTAADSFSTIYPLRTRLIRRFGRLPDDCGIEQPEPKLLEAIRTGNEYSQRWADGMTKAQVYINAGNDRYLCKYEDDADALLLDPGRLAGVVREGDGLEVGGLEAGGLEVGGLEVGGLEVGGLEVGGLKVGGLDTVRLKVGGVDAGGLKVGMPDVGGVDAGGLEVGMPDVGGVDAGGLEVGMPDVGGVDAGGLDAVGLKAGGLEAGGVDAGGLDADMQEAAIPG